MIAIPDSLTNFLRGANSPSVPQELGRLGPSNSHAGKPDDPSHSRPAEQPGQMNRPLISAGAVASATAAMASCLAWPGSLQFTLAALSVSSLSFLCAACVLLNSLGRSGTCASGLLVAGSNLLTLTLAIVYGKDAQCHAQFYPLVLLPLFAFPGSQRQLAIGFVTSAGCFTLVQFELIPGPIIRFDPELLPSLVAWNSVTAFAMLSAMVVTLGLRQHETQVNGEKSKADGLRLLATMSHEIRTPLASIIGLTEVVLDQELKSQQRYLLNMVHSAEESLLYIVNNTLDFIKMEANKLALEVTEEFDIVDFVEDTIAVFAAFAQKKGVELATEFDPKLLNSSPELRGDVKRLRQILWNLISNAIKFTPEGQVLVRVSFVAPKTAALAPASVTLLFEVVDTGVGIDEVTQKVLFSEYTQAAGFSRNYGGTGLGLSICKRLVELMGSSISVRSQPGKGSTFSFPITFQVAPTGIPDSSAEPRKTHRILLVSPRENKMFHSLKQVLGCWSHDCHLVNLKQAVQILRGEERIFGDPDLIFVDYSDGEGEMRTFARLCKTLAPLSKVVAAIPFTSSPPEDETLFHDFIAVPTKTSHLRTLLSKLSSSASLPARTRTPKSPSLNDMVESQLVVASLSEKAGSRRSSDSEEAQSSLESSSKDLVVLVVEDNQLNQKVMTAFLRNLGVKCEVVADGLEALRAATSGVPYNLILMDQEMPNMTGLEATKKIRQHERQFGGRIPIVGLSGNVSLEDQEECFSAGMDEFLVKPVSFRDLTQVITKMVLKERK